MNKDPLRSKLKNFIKPIYAFSFCLIPDELQAGQLVIDTVDLFLNSKKPDFVENAEHFEIQIGLYQSCYQIALKRIQHMQLGLTLGKEDFFQLDFQERAILFLKIKEEFSLADCSQIMKKNERDLLSLYSLAKNKRMNQLEVNHL